MSGIVTAQTLAVRFDLLCHSHKCINLPGRIHPTETIQPHLGQSSYSLRVPIYLSIDHFLVAKPVLQPSSGTGAQKKKKALFF